MLKPCAEPGCPEPASYRGRCPSHSRQRERTTHPNRAIYNSAKWKYTRRRKLFDVPLCERCGALATEVHHRHGVRVDPWSMAGLESLCHPCHSRTTRQEQLSGGREGGLEPSQMANTAGW